MFVLVSSAQELFQLLL
uniref:Uncharacterized protein n=1 Tax=Anguilla anguilla TaxID=7936 RepID=A0A0E9PJ10_ANGAN